MANFLRSPLFITSALACIALSLLIGNNRPKSIEETPTAARVGPNDDDSQTILRTPEQWHAEYNCSGHSSLVEQTQTTNRVRPLGALATRIADQLRADRCRNRHPSSWRYKYFDELSPDRFQPLVLEHSLDQRLANIIYLVTPTRAFRGDMDVFKFNSGDAKQDVANKRLVAGPQVNNQLCEKHLKLMVALASELQTKLESGRLHENRSTQSRLHLDERHIHLARVLDSFGRYESGHLSGKHFSIGSYEQCTTSQLILGEEDEGRSRVVKTRFCWAKFNTDRHLSLDLELRPRRPDETGENLFRSGICIPETCHSMSFDDQNIMRLAEKLASSQFKLPQSIYLDKSLELQSVFCPVDEDSRMAQLPPSGKYLLLLLGLLIIYTAYKKALDWYMVQPPDPRDTCRKQLQAALAHAVHPTTSRQRVNINLLNVIKVVLTMQMVLTHAGALVSSYNSNFLSAIPQTENDQVIMSLLSNAEVVDTFFVISGMLLAFSFMNRLERIDTREYSCRRLAREWMRFTLNRYLKLIPLLAMVLWFKKSIFPRLPPGGPQWDYGLNKDAGIGYCVQEQSWWTLLMPTSNFKQAHVARQCLPVAWSVPVDLLFAFVLPPLVYLLMMQAPLFVPAIASLIVWLTYASYQAFMEFDRQTFWDMWETRPYSMVLLSTSLSYVHTNPWRRLSSCLVGLIGGFFVYLYQAVPELKWHRTFKGMATIWALCILTLQFIGMLYVFKIRHAFDPYHLLWLPHIFSTSRLLYAIANTIILVRVVTDWSGFLTKHLIGGSAMQTWLTLNKLGYAIGLIHWDVMNYDLSTMTRDILFGRREIISLFLRAYSISAMLGVVVHNLVQQPLDELVRRGVMVNI